MPVANRLLQYCTGAWEQPQTCLCTLLRQLYHGLPEQETRPSWRVVAGRQGWSERGHQLHLRLSSPEDCGRSWALRAVQLCLCTRCSTGSPEKHLSALAYWEVKKLSLVNIFPAFCSISSHIFKFSTGNTLSTFETDWLVYLVEAFTGAKASFLTLTALGSSEPFDYFDPLITLLNTTLPCSGGIFKKWGLILIFWNFFYYTFSVWSIDQLVASKCKEISKIED